MFTGFHQHIALGCFPVAWVGTERRSTLEMQAKCREVGRNRFCRLAENVGTRHTLYDNFGFAGPSAFWSPCGFRAGSSRVLFSWNYIPGSRSEAMCGREKAAKNPDKHQRRRQGEK